MRLQHRFEELGGYVLEDRIAAILQGLGIPHRQEARLTELSGGERVKVALAKILAADADLLLLDEPTSNLDSLTEAMILKSLLNVKAEKLIILVSHRQSTMAICDQVIGIENGRIS